MSVNGMVESGPKPDAHQPSTLHVMLRLITNGVVGVTQRASHCARTVAIGAVEKVPLRVIVRRVCVGAACLCYAVGKNQLQRASLAVTHQARRGTRERK